jgi:hypothetical protein
VHAQIDVDLRHHLHVFWNGKNANALAVFLKIALHANEDGWAWPGRKSILRDTGISTPHALSAALRHLRGVTINGQRVFEHYRERKGKKWGRSIYLIFPDLPHGDAPDDYENLVVWNPKKRSKEEQAHQNEDHPHVDDPHAEEPHVDDPHHEVEPFKEEPSKGAAGAAEVSPPAGAPPMYQGYAFIVTHFPEDLTFDCPNPECGQTSVPWPKKRTKFVCPHCQAPLAGFELGNDEKGTPDWKPPARVVPKEEKRILGNLIPNCPAELRQFPYLERDKAGILAVLAAARPVLLSELDHQRQMWLAKRGTRNGVAHNGMVSAQHKIGATRKESDGDQAQGDAGTAAPSVGHVPVWPGSIQHQPSQAS